MVYNIDNCTIDNFVISIIVSIFLRRCRYPASCGAFSGGCFTFFMKSACFCTFHSYYHEVYFVGVLYKQFLNLFQVFFDSWAKRA